MHHDSIAFSQLQTRGGHLVSRNVVLEAYLLTCQPLLLHSQQHDYVGAAQSVFDAARDAEAGHKRGGNIGHELGWPTERNLHPELRQQMAGAPGHTTVVDVPDNCGLQTFERFLMFENGEGIKQCLRGMLVHPVACVDHWNVEVPRHQVWSAGGRMPKYDGICPDCPQRVD